jgi:acyl-CoA dehydrogenase
MDFTFGEDADMVRQTAHEFARRTLLPREPEFINAEDSGRRKAITDDAVASLKETGLYSAGVPEQFGGGGLGPLESCLIAEELSQSVIPVEWGELTPVLYECSDAQKPEYLAPVVEGSRRYVLAFNEPRPFTAAAGMATTAAPTDSGYVLNGTKILTRADADFCVVFALTPEGPSAFLLDRGIANAEIRIRDTDPPEAELELKGCVVAKEKLLGQLGKAMGLGRKWFGLSRIVRAAATLGACDRLLQVTAQYARDWLQMGEHISERRSIQQLLADMTGDIESLRWLVYRTVWLSGEGKQVEYDSMLTKLQAQKVLTDTVNRSVRVHGGTMPPIAGWLARNQASERASDMLRFAVARETISRLLP